MSVTDILESMEYGPAPESPQFVNEWLDHHQRRFGQFIGGSWVQSNESFEVFNPGNGSVICTVGQTDDAQVDAAVRAARTALPLWQGLTGEERGRYLYVIARQIQKHARLFAVLESMDNGKPIRETRDLDIPLAARHFYYHAGWAALLETSFPNHQALGVCGQIIPWNFPLLMLAWKIAPALACGNTVVLKPAEFTPLTGLLFAEICTAAGLPAGVVNIITGDGACGAALVNHPDVNKIAFTGSTEVGRIIRRATAGTGKKLSLELGGKSPFIVFEDADLDGAVEGLVDAIWFNQGQVCCAGSRLLVQESIAEKLLKKIRARMENLRVGDPLDKAIDIGAIVAPVQLERINELVQKGLEEGAEIFQPTWACPREGWFYPPTLLTNVEPASTVAQIEIFGPVLVAMTFRTPCEAVELANNTVYGLAASVWTENINLAHDIAARVKAGTIWVNCTNQFDASSGFGGFRESGYGREGGPEGLREYLAASFQPVSETSNLANESKSPGPLTPYPLSPGGARGELDRTHKLYIGGKQVRPDGNYSFEVEGQEIARGNRKDIRNAVEAAQNAAKAWANTPAFTRAQILYYLAENLQDWGPNPVFECAAMTDKFEGSVHEVPMRGFTYTRNEPIGVIGIVCPNSTEGLLKLTCMAIGMGNTVVVIPSSENPIPAVELYRILEMSDIPAGVVNIVTGLQDELIPTLADHDGVDSIWYFGPPEGAADVELRSCGNLKQTWATRYEPWLDIRYLCERATQVKNIWIPMGE